MLTRWSIWQTTATSTSTGTKTGPTLTTTKWPSSLTISWTSTSSRSQRADWLKSAAPNSTLEKDRCSRKNSSLQFLVREQRFFTTFHGEKLRWKRNWPQSEHDFSKRETLRFAKWHFSQSIWDWERPCQNGCFELRRHHSGIFKHLFAFFMEFQLILS